MHDDLFSKSFDHLLAFVLPGLVVLWGYSYFDPTGLGAWFKTASTADTGLGGFLFLVLAALALGVFVSGFRWLVLEHWLRLFPSPPALDDHKRIEPGVSEALADARHHHYYYYLFYANMACALPVVFVGWKWTTTPAPSWAHVFAILGLFLAAELVLVLSARHAISRFKTKAERILGILDRSSGSDERRLASRRRT
jgi:hypothetical protein